MSERAASAASDLPVVGLPADAPARPTSGSMAYPAVHDMPTPRGANLLSNLELKQFQDDLIAAREEQQKKLAPPPRQTDRKKPAVASKPATPARPASAATRPAPSSTSAIY